MEIIEEKQNKLFNRKEVKVVVDAGKTPSFAEALNLVSENFKTPEENIVIEKVKGKFGRNTFLIGARIYDSKQDKEKTEPKKKEKTSEGKPAEQAQAPAEKKEEKSDETAEETKPTVN